MNNLNKLIENIKNYQALLHSPESEWESLLLDAEISDSDFETATALLAKASMFAENVYNVLDVLINKLSEYLPNKNLTTTDIEALAALASEFSSSEDEILKRQAIILDKALEVIAENKLSQNDFDNLKKKYIQREQDEKYIQVGKTLAKINKTEGIGDKISQQMKSKEYRPMQHSLSTRYCPDHPGVGIMALADGQYQCSMDKKIYDFKNGYTKVDGDKVPGGAVENQTKMVMENTTGRQNFDTRENRQQK